MQDERAQDSQQEPQQDSGLQTPQPDQPIPTERDMQRKEADAVKRGSDQEVVRETRTEETHTEVSPSESSR